MEPTTCMPPHNDLTVAGMIYMITSMGWVVYVIIGGMLYFSDRYNHGPESRLVQRRLKDFLIAILMGWLWPAVALDFGVIYLSYFLKDCYRLAISTEEEESGEG